MANLNFKVRGSFEDYYHEFNRMGFLYDACFTPEEIAKMDTILRSALNGKKPSMPYFDFNVSFKSGGLIFSDEYMTIYINESYTDFKQNMRILKNKTFRLADVEVVYAIMSVGSLLLDAFTIDSEEESEE